MEKPQNEGRWFLVKHDCDAIFTINSLTFKSDRENKLICPNCGKKIVAGAHLKQISTLFMEYGHVSKSMEDCKASIREITPKELYLPKYLLTTLRD